MKLRYLALPAAVVLATACFDGEPDLARSRYACQFDGDCLHGYVCRAHPEGKYCTPYNEALDDVATPPADTATPDATEGSDILAE